MSQTREPSYCYARLQREGIRISAQAVDDALAAHGLQAYEQDPHPDDRAWWECATVAHEDEKHSPMAIFQVVSSNGTGSTGYVCRYCLYRIAAVYRDGMEVVVASSLLASARTSVEAPRGDVREAVTA